ncbi:hypothetical protein [Clostridium butyricum]|uniref:hypothetical protein n=1 Tax=Clostridium butyricum TaxID=1492 RepID=UPI001A9A31CD|nr:hypothetical protein [Clostridium butyricum]
MKKKKDSVVVSIFLIFFQKEKKEKQIQYRINRLSGCLPMGVIGIVFYRRIKCHFA